MKARDVLEKLAELVEVFPDAELVVDFANDLEDTIPVDRVHAFAREEVLIVLGCA